MREDGVIAVSSPHRYCRNPVTGLPERPVDLVSSPHRYCRNRPSSRHAAAQRGFQALIGTVETGFGAGPGRPVDRFKPS